MTSVHHPSEPVLLGPSVAKKLRIYLHSLAYSLVKTNSFAKIYKEWIPLVSWCHSAVPKPLSGHMLRISILVYPHLPPYNKLTPLQSIIISLSLPWQSSGSHPSGGRVTHVTLTNQHNQATHILSLEIVSDKGLWCEESQYVVGKDTHNNNWHLCLPCSSAAWLLLLLCLLVVGFIVHQ